MKLKIASNRSNMILFLIIWSLNDFHPNCIYVHISKHSMSDLKDFGDLTQNTAWEFKCFLYYHGGDDVTVFVVIITFCSFTFSFLIIDRLTSVLY